MPDFFGSEPMDISNYPPKLPKYMEAIKDFFGGPADPAKTLAVIGPLMGTLKEKYPEIKSWGIMGYCGYC
jgi:hypothetical protein